MIRNSLIKWEYITAKVNNKRLGCLGLSSTYYRGLIKDLECRSGKVFLDGVEVSDISEVLSSLENAEVINDNKIICFT